MGEEMRKVHLRDYDIAELGKVEIRAFDLKMDWVSMRDGGSTIDAFLEAISEVARAVIFDFESNVVVILYE